MSDVVNTSTGEVMSADDRAFAIKKAEGLLEFTPTNPIEMEYLIREANGLLERMPDVMLEINERRYKAERAYSARKNSQMVFHGRQGLIATFARAQAEVDAQSELEAWHVAKAEYHYAEDTERALRTKVMSMLNINRSISTQFGSHR